MDQAAPVLIGTLADALQQTHTTLMTHPSDKALHDFRVALRRCRAVLRELRCVDDESWQSLLQAARDIAQETNLIRDVDVCRADLLQDDSAACEPGRALLRHLAARKARAMQLARRQLHQVPMILLQPLHQLAQKKFTGPCAHQSFQDTAAVIIKERACELVQSGSKLKPRSSARKYHRVRIRAKRLRYTLEIFAPALGNDISSPLLGSLKKLQNNLGVLQDLAVQADLLEAFAKRHPGHENDAIHVFIKHRRQRLQQRKLLLRQEFAELFPAFVTQIRSFPLLAQGKEEAEHCSK
jgi:CHAD domain-containing protein